MARSIVLGVVTVVVTAMTAVSPARSQVGAPTDQSNIEELERIRMVASDLALKRLAGDEPRYALANGVTLTFRVNQGTLYEVDFQVVLPSADSQAAQQPRDNRETSALWLGPGEVSELIAILDKFRAVGDAIPGATNMLTEFPHSNHRH